MIIITQMTVWFGIIGAASGETERAEKKGEEEIKMRGGERGRDWARLCVYI